MATPFVTGAVANLAAAKNPNNGTEVASIRSYVRALGNYDWTDQHIALTPPDFQPHILGDGSVEPLLQMGTPPPPPPPAPPTATIGAANIGNIANPVYTGDITVTTPKMRSYVPPGAPAPLRQDNGNIDVFTRLYGVGDELDFTRATSGMWTSADLTPAGQPKIGASSAVLRMKNGAMHAFAMNKSGDIILEQGRVPRQIPVQGVGADVLRHRIDHVGPFARPARPVPSQPLIGLAAQNQPAGSGLPLERVVAMIPVRLDPLADRVDDAVKGGLRGCDQLAHLDSPSVTGAPCHATNGDAGIRLRSSSARTRGQFRVP